MTLFLGLIGIVLLVGGAELLVRGASRLAIGLGISPVVVGLTVVAFGTSAPEMAVSLQAAFAGESDLTVGNVVGSNIFNALFILGASALVVPLVVAQRLIRIDVPLMVAVSVAVLVFGLNGHLGRLEGGVLFAALVAYIGFAVYESKRDAGAIEAEYEEGLGGEGAGHAGVFANLGLIIVGLALLVLGSDWLVEGAKQIALDAGLSELVVGLTIVAAGTSLPEVATSLIAAFKGERDIAVGNVVGSNIFNLLGVLGLSSLVSPDAVGVSDTAIRFDLPVMAAVAIACLPVFFTGMISRWQGLLFLGFYTAYLGYLVLNSSEHAAIGTYSFVMLMFVLPLSGIALLAGYARHLHLARRESSSTSRG